MNLTPTYSPVVRVMHQCYIHMSEKFDMEKVKQSKVWATRQYLFCEHGSKLKITEHAVLRMWQQLNEDEHSQIFTELIEVLKGNMYKKMFVGKQTHVNLVLSNDITIGFGLASNRLIVKTVFKKVA